MADLLLELFSEEIPARMQKRAADDLKSALDGLFKASDVQFKSVDTYFTPRRLTAHVTGLPKGTKDVKEERRGPKVGAPEQAVAGFSKSVGLNPDQLTERDGYYYASVETKGQSTSDIIAEGVPALLKKFPWPKSMRWGAGTFKWVRPLHSILCLLDGKVVPFEVGGIQSGNSTEGHRFLSPGAFEVTGFEDYKHKLNKAYVMLDVEDRRKEILKQADKKVVDSSSDTMVDEGLLREVCGLVEWPVVHLGTFDKAFLDIPAEALMSEMHYHQKYFPIFIKKSGNLSNKFLFVANMVTADKGKAIVTGNERVLSARLYDAKFFWDQDRRIKLDDRLPLLKDIVFHEKLGSVADRVKRIEKLAVKIAESISSQNVEKAKRAAHLSKADLVTGMVGEFPDLQGIMGGYYALDQDEDEAVANAIGEQYSPAGPNDHCPSDPVSVCLALAEKLEKLMGFFSIDEKPTGSKDPFALRRAALGVIRLIVKNDLRIRLQHEIKISDDLMAFLADRLKVQQREKGVRHDLIDAIFSLGHEDDLVRILARVSALQDFLKTEDGENLLAGHKRAVNILRIEESKDGNRYLKKVDPGLLRDETELALYSSLQAAKKTITQTLIEEDYAGAMTAVAKLRGPIDDFFDNVKVNVSNKKVRENRLQLLAGIRTALMPVADFSKIEG